VADSFNMKEQNASQGFSVAVEDVDRDSKRASAGKYLTFELGAEVYAIEVLQVNEIIRMVEITRVPRTPSFVRGVINLRGRIVPVVDLRLRFGLESKQDSDRTCIVVVHRSGGKGNNVMGLVVDHVRDVLEISEDQIDPPPTFGASSNSAFVLGLGKLSSAVAIMIDVEKILTDKEARLCSDCDAQSSGPSKPVITDEPSTTPQHDSE
jgi:purine-binding chemotaxis protein CheW